MTSSGFSRIVPAALALLAGRACGDPCSFVRSADRSCTRDADCFVAAHEPGCCSEIEVVGMNVAERSHFEDAERECRATRPPCGCPPGPARFDDGSRLLAQGEVTCRSGTCTSFVRGCGGPCAEGRRCDRCVTDAQTFYYVCSIGCRASADCTDPALPSCAPGSAGALFCTAAGAGCRP